MVKKIYFEPAGRIHSSQWHLINYPPEGYEFLVDPITAQGKDLLLNDFFLFKSRRFLEWLMPLNLTKAWIDSRTRRIPEDVDLIYAYNHPVFRRKNWVGRAEWAHVLVGRNIQHFGKWKNLVEKTLSSEYCKKILVWTEWAMKSILLNFSCADFEHKLRVVPLAVPVKKFTKDYNKKKVTLLYVGSANVRWLFDIKGGKEVLEVFAVLNKKYENLELVLRTRIPSNIKKKYGCILKMDNVRVIEDILPWKDLERVFVNASIFIFPTHDLQETVILDAMSYGLPIITTEIGSTGRIKNGITGFVVKDSEKVPYFWNNEGLRFIPSGATPQRHEFQRAIQATDPKLVEELTEKTAILIEDHKLREKMGKAAKWEVDYGSFSIKRRNEKLKRIFDESTN